MKGLFGLLPAAALVAASPVTIGTIHKDSAPLYSSTTAKEIPDSYMVVFKKDIDHYAAKAHHEWVNTFHTQHEDSKMELRKRGQFPIVDTVFDGLKHTFAIPGSLLGYSGHFDEHVIETIRRQPDVAWVERDSEVHVLDEDKPELETGAPWGLARISHRQHLSFGTFNKYLYSSYAGEGVDVYVIDTGTFTDHVDFEGRASWGTTLPDDDGDEDKNGHGTHCSGTIAGKKYGVSKKANIIAVKVLRGSGSGSMSDVVKGVDWATSSHNKKVKAAKDGKDKKFRGSTANMSLGGGHSPTLNAAVNAAVDNGIHFAVAAGNDNQDACSYSPAGAENAVTVGASTLADERAYFSNWGNCTDIFAPGLNIKSTWIGTEYAVNTISGTSMASPHIAGLLAYFVSLQPAPSSGYAVAAIEPKELKKNLIEMATPGALTELPKDTVNLLAWNGGGSSNFTKIVDSKVENYKLKAAPKDSAYAEWVHDMEDVFDQELEELKTQFKELMESTL